MDVFISFYTLIHVYSNTLISYLNLLIEVFSERKIIDCIEHFHTPQLCHISKGSSSSFKRFTLRVNDITRNLILRNWSQIFIHITVRAGIFKESWNYKSIPKRTYRPTKTWKELEKNVSFCGICVLFYGQKYSNLERRS